MGYLEPPWAVSSKNVTVTVNMLDVIMDKTPTHALFYSTLY